MLLLASATATYTAHVLTGVASLGPRALRRARDSVLVCGSTLSVVMLLAATLYYRGRRGLGGLQNDVVLIVTIGAIALLHVALLITFAWRQRGRSGAKSLRHVLQAYVALVFVVALAIPAHQIEHTGCPDWLFSSGVSVHAIWCRPRSTS